jgi:hypothetical protein
MAGASGDAGEGSERGSDDVRIHPNAKNRSAVRRVRQEFPIETDAPVWPRANIAATV